MLSAWLNRESHSRRVPGCFRKNAKIFVMPQLRTPYRSFTMLSQFVQSQTTCKHKLCLASATWCPVKTALSIMGRQGTNDISTIPNHACEGPDSHRYTTSTTPATARLAISMASRRYVHFQRLTRPENMPGRIFTTRRYTPILGTWQGTAAVAVKSKANVKSKIDVKGFGSSREQRRSAS